ncbi:zinc-dependent peptidase [Sediminibacterium sp. WSJ-3]|nr:zinc-dependent peptidase [Sediminibacterium soli]
MSFLPVILLCVAVLALYVALFGKRHRSQAVSLPPLYKEVLLKDVAFYRQLNEQQRQDFENRMVRFLAATRIIGVGTDVTDADKVYISASAIIPIFGLGDWEYTNLDEILLYPDAFGHDFQQTGDERSVLGVIGEGALQRVMVLSQRALRHSFQNNTDREHTAIHEFVHLIDKADGSTDGVPEFFLGREYIKPWLQLIHKEINRIRDNRSDINPYGITNEAEFFAVVSEYFFARPDLLEKKHPELYRLLVQAFHQNPNA